MNNHFSHAKISVFETAFSTVPGATATLGECLAEIKSDEHKTAIELLRAQRSAGNEKGYARQKRAINAVCISGTCSTRDANMKIEDKFLSHSGYLQIDLDGKENPRLKTDIAEICTALRSCPHVASYFVSPSGDGLKVIVRVPASLALHDASWHAADKLFRESWSLIPDKSTKDPLRLCFVSYDPNAWTREEDATELDLPETSTQTPKPRRTLEEIAKQHRKTTADDIVEMLQFIPPRPDYEKWLRIASAVWSTLDEPEGTRILQAWSPEEQPGEYSKKFSKRLHQVGIGSLVYYAKEGGFDAVLAARRANWCGRAYFGSMLKLEHHSLDDASPAPLSESKAEERVEDYTSLDMQPREISSHFAMQCFINGQRGDAELFAASMVGLAIYNNKAEAWFRYLNGIWVRDETDQIRKIFQEFITSVYRRMTNEIEEGTSELNNDSSTFFAKKVSARIDRLNTLLYATNALKLAQAMLPAVATDFDANPYLCATNNGTLDLKLGDFRPHSPKDMLTQRLPVSFSVDARCPHWDSFIDSIFGSNQETIDFVRRCVGYSLSGSTNEDALFFLVGAGANGKSVFRNTLEMLFGSYSTSIKIEALLTNMSDSNVDYQKARFKGARVVFTDEVPENKRFNESQIKAITGRDPILARAPFEKPYMFSPTHKLWLIGNHKPTITGTDNGIWRRICIIPFKVIFPKEQQVKPEVFQNWFSQELPGILNWALRGWCDYQQKGLSQPAEVREATNEYRSEQDQIGAFFEECLVAIEGAKISTQALYKAYTAWCEEDGEYPICRTKRKLTTKLMELGYKIDKGAKNKMHLFDYILSENNQALDFSRTHNYYE